MNECGADHLTSSAAQTRRPQDAALKEALRSMLRELEPRPLIPTPPPPKFSNWRTRKIISEIKALANVNALEQYEDELRALLRCQESRVRGKLTTRFLYEECNIEERGALGRLESAGREAIDAEMRVAMWQPMDIVTFEAAEEVARRYLSRERRSFMRTRRVLRDIDQLIRSERDARALLRAQESLERQEARNRRFMEVGQEVQRELCWRNHADMFAWLHSHSRDYVTSVRAISRAEERDRYAIEHLSLLHLTVFYNECEAELCQSVRRSIDTSSSLTLSNAARAERELRLARQVTFLVEQEEQLRLMIEDGEATEQQVVWSAFVIGWRDVYKEISQSHDLVRILTNVELFERRYIYDEYRNGLNTITSMYAVDHKAALVRDAAFIALYETYVRGVTALWKEEGEEFNALHFQYHLFDADCRAFQATRVLELEEARDRYFIVGEEVRLILRVHALRMVERCWLDARAGAERIAALEADERSNLSRAWTHVVLTVASEALMRAEREERATVENAQFAAALTLHVHAQQLAYGGVASVPLAELGRMEVRYRRAAVASEEAERRGLILSFLVAQEQADRRWIRRNESYMRTAMHLCEVVLQESVERAAIGTMKWGSWHAIKASAISAEEDRSRLRLHKAESERIQFLTASVPYQNLMLRACEVDELAHRLHIVNEAELSLRACAYGAGHDAAVAYCTEDLRMQQVQLRFLPLEALLREHGRELVLAQEPQGRLRIEHEWRLGALAMKLALAEQCSRAQLVDLEEISWRSFLSLSCRVLGVARSSISAESDTESLSTHKDLLRYLQRQRVQVSCDVVKRRAAAVRDAMRAFMEELYWSRDTIHIEESVSRASIVAASRGAMLSCDSSPHFQLHSVAVAVDTPQSPAQLRLWLNGSASSDVSVVVLGSHRTVNAAGRIAQVCFPAPGQAVWCINEADFYGILHYEVLDNDETVMAAGSHLLSDHYKGKLCIEMEFADGMGRIHLASYV